MKFLQISIIFFLFKIITVFSVPTDIDSVKAIVNHNIILDSDIKNKIKIMQHNECDIGQLYDFYDKNLYDIALNQLIIDNLIIQTVIKENLKIDHNQLEQIISSIAHFKNMTLHQFYIYLNNIGLNYKYYSSEIYHNILKQLICNYVIFQQQYNYNISTNEIEDIAKKINFINFNKQFKLTHTIIDLPVPTSSLQISKSENLAKSIIKKRTLYQDINTIIKLYYNNNILPKITVKPTEWVSWKNIPVIFDQYLETAKKGDIIGPIQTYDGIHILEIEDICIKECIFPIIKVKINDIISKNISDNIHIQQQLLKIKQKIEIANTTFSIITQEKSKDFYSNYYGNSIEWTDLDNFKPEIQKLLLSLKKNQISTPIYTDKGWCLIKLIDINKLNYSEIIYERSYSYVLQKKFNEILNNWIQELKSQSYIKIINQ